MKKYVSLICAISAAITLVSCTINKPAEKERTITVSGTGTVLVKPDLISLNFGVKTTDRGVALTVDRNAQITTKVINALKENGIAESDIVTKDYRIYQENQQTMPGRYSVTNTINVLIRNPDTAGSIIDLAVANGANTLNSFEYLVSDKTSALRQARTLAIQDAQDAATLLAGASGNKVNSVLEINENFTNQSAAVSGMRLYSENAVSTPLESGTVSVTSEVTIKYSLE